MYKKHYPPALHDEVWRLDRIAKDGALHKKLIKAAVVTVEDFLRLLVKDPQRLRSVSISCIYSQTPFNLVFLGILISTFQNIDAWEWDVQQDVGKYSGACQNLCLGWEALCLLH